VLRCCGKAAKKQKDGHMLSGSRSGFLDELDQWRARLTLIGRQQTLPVREEYDQLLRVARLCFW